VLLTEGCGIAPLIHGHAGLAVAPTSDALAEGMHSFLADTERRAALTLARSDVLRELSWKGPLEQMERVYRETVQSYPSRVAQRLPA